MFYFPDTRRSMKSPAEIKTMNQSRLWLMTLLRTNPHHAPLANTRSRVRLRTWTANTSDICHSSHLRKYASDALGFEQVFFTWFYWTYVYSPNQIWVLCVILTPSCVSHMFQFELQSFDVVCSTSWANRDKCCELPGLVRNVSYTFIQDSSE